MQELKFFLLIIGTEILNRRREDAHFDFVTQALGKKGYKLAGSFVIEDDPELIIETIKFIATTYPDATLFSFGGIGSTPDDYTRQCACDALSDGELLLHEEAKTIIESKWGEKAYPHAIKMAYLPKKAKLIEHTARTVPAFCLEGKYYFMAGFPELSHPLVSKILDTLIPQKRIYYRNTLTAFCKESLLIEVMEKMPKEVELSSLPKLREEGWEVSISIASYDKKITDDAFVLYIQALQRQKIPYILEEDL